MEAARGGDRLSEGRSALEAARWDAARAAFEAALEVEDTPEAREGLGEALWLLSEVQEGIAEVECAFEGYVRSGKSDRAARAAVWVSHQYWLSGRASASRGWLARAERALTGAATGPGHGWVEVERARHAASVEERIAHSERAMAIGREAGAADLEIYALSLLGRAQVSAGRRGRGCGSSRRRWRWRRRGGPTTSTRSVRRTAT